MRLRSPAIPVALAAVLALAAGSGCAPAQTREQARVEANRALERGYQLLRADDLDGAADEFNRARWTVKKYRLQDMIEEVESPALRTAAEVVNQDQSRAKDLRLGTLARPVRKTGQSTVDHMVDLNAHAVLLVKSGKFSDAIATYSAMPMEQVPREDRVVYRHNWARALELRGRHRDLYEATQLYKLALEEDRGNHAATVGVLRLLRLRGARNLKAYLEFTETLIEAGQVELAERQLKPTINAWARDDATVDLVYALMRCYERRRLSPDEYVRVERGDMPVKVRSWWFRADDELEDAYADLDAAYAPPATAPAAAAATGASPPSQKKGRASTEIPLLTRSDAAERIFKSAKNYDRRRRLSQFLTFAAEQHLLADRAMPAFLRYCAAFALDERNSNAAAQAAAVLGDHPDLEVPPDAVAQLSDAIVRRVERPPRDVGDAQAYQSELLEAQTLLARAIGGRDPERSQEQWRRVLDAVAASRQAHTLAGAQAHNELANLFRATGESAAAADAYLTASGEFAALYYGRQAREALDRARSVLGPTPPPALATWLRDLEATVARIERPPTTPPSTTPPSTTPPSTTPPSTTPPSATPPSATPPTTTPPSTTPPSTTPPSTTPPSTTPPSTTPPTTTPPTTTPPSTTPPGSTQAAPKPLFRDPVHDGAADPVVTWNRGEGKWFMFYTNRRANVPDLKGVSWVHGTAIGIAESSDGGTTWTYRGTADIRYGAPPHSYWAPDVFEHDGAYHMFLTYVPGMHTDWTGTREIVHLTSKDLWTWDDPRPLKLASDRVIDASVVRLPGGGWRLWYNNEADGKSIYFADSDDLITWRDRGKGVGDQPGEGPKVFRWKGHYWMIVDVWDGQGVYRSDDAQRWERQPGNLLRAGGTGGDDGTHGLHADVVVNDDRAYLFYFTHPGRTRGNEGTHAHRRSSIQVVELFEKDGRLTCDRNAPAFVRLVPPEKPAPR